MSKIVRKNKGVRAISGDTRGGVSYDLGFQVAEHPFVALLPTGADVASGTPKNRAAYNGEGCIKSLATPM